MTTIELQTRPKLSPSSPWDSTENNFDLLRLVASVAVIYAHSYPLSGDFAHEPPYGAIAVNVFFLISGFLITASWQRSASARDYLRRRVARIYPGFVCASVITTMIISPLFMPDWHELFTGRALWHFFRDTARLSYIPASHVFSHNPLPNNANGSLWTIPYEFWCYLGVLLLGVLGLLRPWVLGLLLVVLAFAGGLSFPHRMDALRPALEAYCGTFDHWARLGTYFLWGSFFCLCRRRTPMKGWLAALAAVMIGMEYRGILSHVAPPATTYLVLWLSYQPYVRFPHFARYGDFSYGTYLYAFPIQQTLVAAFPGRWNAWGLFAVAAPLSVAAGALSWHLVEKRFLRVKRVKAFRD